MKVKDFIDAHIDLAERVRMLELRRAEGGGALAPNADHDHVLAEWLSIPSCVPAGSFSVGRAAAALWEAENEETDVLFHSLMRVVRETVGAIKALVLANTLTFNQFEARPHVLTPDTSGMAGIDGSAAAPPRFIVMQNAPGWWYRVLVPGAPRVASFSTGVHSVPFGSPGRPEDAGRGSSQGLILGNWSAFSFVGATPPNIVLRGDPVPGDPAPTDSGYVIMDPFGFVQSGYSRGAVAYMEATIADVTNPSPPPAVLENAIVGATMVKAVSATILQDDGQQRFYPLPFKRDEPPEGRLMAASEVESDTPPPSGVPLPRSPIIDYTGTDVGAYYQEEPQPDINVIAYSFNVMDVLCWGPPFRAADVGISDPLNPPAAALGDWADDYVWGPQNGSFLEENTPTEAVAFELVVSRIGLVPEQITDWADAIIEKVEETAPAYEHVWVKQDMNGDVWASKRYGLTTLRGYALVDGGQGLGDITRDHIDAFCRQFVAICASDMGPLQVIFFVGDHSLAVGVNDPAYVGARVSLDGIQFPCQT